MYQERNTEFETRQSAGPAVNQEMDYDIMEIPPKSHQQRLPIIICIVLLLILLIEVGFFFMRIHAIRSERTRYVPDAQVTMATAGETFGFGPKQRDITIKEVEDMGWQEGLPTGYKLVRVNCLLGYQDESIYEWRGKLYLQTDNSYYPVANSYQLEKMDPQLMVHALDTYNLLRQKMDEGWVYFVVPEDASEGILWLNAVEEDSDYVTVSVQSTGVPIKFDEKGETDNA